MADPQSEAPQPKLRLLELSCPHCGYDLGVATRDEGTCPECGHEYSAQRLQRCNMARAAFALGLMGWGGLAVCLGGLVGSAVAFLPVGKEGTPGNAGAVSELLRVVPLCAASCGVGVLGYVTARTAGQRRWPMISACVLSIASVLTASITQHGWYGTTSHWWQPQSWVHEWTWLYSLSFWFVVIAGCAVVRRDTLMEPTPSARRAVAILSVLAIAGWVGNLAWRFVWYRANSELQAANVSQQFDDYWYWQALESSLGLIQDAMELAAWMGLGLASLFARQQLSAIRAGQRG